MNKYTPIIGLEVHVELKTKSKMFCSCSADYFGKAPNSHTCPVCLGLPGALPVPNKTAIEWCIKIAHALNCNINEYSKFDRKNYFYPDLAKGYQISQYDLPFGYEGFIDIHTSDSQKPTAKRKIRIRRVHMEEDTGKLSHQNIKGERTSLIDFNRSGVPLVEIVTEPDFHDALEVKEYLQKLQHIVRYLDVSNADMEKGEMRLEPNISLALTTSLRGSASLRSNEAIPSKLLPNYKVEVKNINSFSFVEKAVKYEIRRQEEILENGKIPAQETRGWDENRQKTFSQRSKEDAHDYRYFPEPDIPPIVTTKEEISRLKSEVPELQEKKLQRFVSQFGLTSYDAEILTREKLVADYFEEAVREGKAQDIKPKEIANAIINKKVTIEETTPLSLVKKIFESKKKETIDEDELKKIIDTVLAEQTKAVEDYRNGKEQVLMFLVGQTMKKIGKKVDVNMVKEKLQKQIV